MASLISAIVGFGTAKLILAGRKSVSVSEPMLIALCILAFLVVWLVGFEGRGED